jgi:hypothetical protein
MKNPIISVGKNAEVVYNSNALEAGKELHTTTDEATLTVQGTVEVRHRYHFLTTIFNKVYGFPNHTMYSA